MIMFVENYETNEYKAGYKACVENKSSNQNPYEPGTPQHDLWLEGWSDAYATCG